MGFLASEDKIAATLIGKLDIGMSNQKSDHEEREGQATLAFPYPGKVSGLIQLPMTNRKARIYIVWSPASLKAFPVASSFLDCIITSVAKLEVFRNSVRSLK